MEKHTSPRSQAKRNAILDAAQQCFLEHGYSKTSMDMVAARAGVSKATIYAHFQGKTDLFTAIIRRRCDDYSDGLSCFGQWEEQQDGRQALLYLARHLLTFLVQPEVLAMYRMVVAESPHQPELAQLYYEQGPQRGRARIVDMLQQLMDRGLMPRQNPTVFAEQLTAMLRGEYFNRMLLGLPERPDLTLDNTVTMAVERLLGCVLV